MKTPSHVVLLVAIAALTLGGCAQGPGHTRAAGTLAGTAAGAVVGAAVSPCNRGGGAACGALLGMIGGAVVGEGIAQDQEAYGWCPCCGAAASPRGFRCRRSCR